MRRKLRRQGCALLLPLFLVRLQRSFELADSLLQIVAGGTMIGAALIQQVRQPLTFTRDLGESSRQLTAPVLPLLFDALERGFEVADPLLLRIIGGPVFSVALCQHVGQLQARG